MPKQIKLIHLPIHLASEKARSLMPLRFFLVIKSESYLWCDNVSTSFKTGHSLTDINFASHSKPRDPALSSFLYETEYINQIRTLIKETLDQYAHDNTGNNAFLWELNLRWFHMVICCLFGTR